MVGALSLHCSERTVAAEQALKEAQVLEHEATFWAVKAAVRTLHTDAVASLRLDGPPAAPSPANHSLTFLFYSLFFFTLLLADSELSICCLTKQWPVLKESNLNY